MEQWTSLGLSNDIAQSVLSLGFHTPTLVQQSCIPVFLSNKDVCVESCTGSGKTLSFLLPIFNRLLNTEINGIFAIIIAPARELASQIYEVANSVNKWGLIIDCIIGGHSRQNDIEKFKQQPPSIVIATPGRLLDLLEYKELLVVKSLGILILDEADRLLDLGFSQKLHSILDKLPRQRRTGLFSATMTTDVYSLVKAGLRNPAYITVKDTAIVAEEKTIELTHTLPLGLRNFYIKLPSYKEKLPTLVSFLSEHKTDKVIVFFGTCASSNFYGLALTEFSSLFGLVFFSLNGKMKQSRRERIYREFEEVVGGVLLTTDLVARGIDIPDVTWIIQFDTPQNPDFFVHRIGRTARGDRKGKTLTFLLKPEDTYIEFLKQKQIKLKRLRISLIDCDSIVESVATKCRENYEKAQNAFVSYIRYYKEHHLGFIFSFKKLDIGLLAHSFGLLRIPRIREILGKPIESFTMSEIDPETIRYHNKKREVKRQQELTERQEQIVKQQHKKKSSKNEPKKRTRSDKRGAKMNDKASEWKEMAYEERVVKKIKKRKMNDPEVIHFLETNQGYNLFRKKRRR